ncbi:SOS response-associated peptidase [Photobacterium sp. DNB22_13_2]
MCGRLNIFADMLNNQVSDELRIRYNTTNNPDLCPSQTVETLCRRSVPNTHTTNLQQFAMTWGIKPAWAKKLLINAQVETAMEKPTWRNAMQHRRCIIPCSGWYEWRDEGGTRKQKYLFNHSDGKPLYMAGLWFKASDRELPELVTLTTAANAICRPYHHRMPLLIETKSIRRWLENEQITVQQIAQLSLFQNSFKVIKCTD